MKHAKTTLLWNNGGQEGQEGCLHLLHRVVFCLFSFLPFSTFIQVHPHLKWSFAEHFPLVNNKTYNLLLWKNNQTPKEISTFNAEPATVQGLRGDWVHLILVSQPVWNTHTHSLYSMRLHEPYYVWLYSSVLSNLLDECLVYPSLDTNNFVQYILTSQHITTLTACMCNNIQV